MNFKYTDLLSKISTWLSEHCVWFNSQRNEPWISNTSPTAAYTASTVDYNEDVDVERVCYMWKMDDTMTIVTLMNWFW